MSVVVKWFRVHLFKHLLHLKDAAIVLESDDDYKHALYYHHDSKHKNSKLKHDQLGSIPMILKASDYNNEY